MFKKLAEQLKANARTIVFTEGTDARILEAASRLLASNFLKPILVGKEEEIIAASEESGFNIRGAEIIDPLKFDRLDEMKNVGSSIQSSMQKSMLWLMRW